MTSVTLKWFKENRVSLFCGQNFSKHAKFTKAVYLAHKSESISQRKNNFYQIQLQQINNNNNNRASNRVTDRRLKEMGEVMPHKLERKEKK